MKHFEFGKIQLTDKSRFLNPVTVEVSLQRRGGRDIYEVNPDGENVIVGKTPEYLEFSIIGFIWDVFRSVAISDLNGMETIAKYRDQLNDPDTFAALYDLWLKYHGHGHRAGTPEQEAVVEEWRKTHNYDYYEVCEVLKAQGLYEVNYTGLSVGRRYENEPYRYGTGWLVQEFPEDVVAQVKELLA